MAAVRFPVARRVLAAAGLVLCLVLVGCSTPPPVQRSCCASLAELPYQALASGERVRIHIDESSPSFDFDDGPSRFVAYRLPAGPRLLSVDAESLRPLLPENLLLGPLLGGAPPSRPAPELLLLDAQFRIVRTEALDFREIECTQVHVPADLWMRREFTLDLPPGGAAYLVLKANSALQRAGALTVCGQPARLSPVGRVLLRVEALPAEGGGALEASSRWFEGARSVGLWKEALGLDLAPGRLLLDGARLRYLERGSAGLQPRLDLPRARIVGASMGLRRPGIDALALAVADEAGAVRWHSFLLAPWAGTHASEFVVELAAQQRPDVVQERVAFEVAPWALELDVVPTAGGGPGPIGEAATRGGVFAALPCGLCQMGGCTPEILVTCAAAFSVGAAISGAWAAGREFFAGLKGRGAGTAAPAGVDPRASAAPVAAQAGASLDAAALRQCLAQRLAQQPQPLWRDQGWTARLDAAVAEAAPAGAGARPGAMTVSVSAMRLSLAAGVTLQAASAESWARLEIEASLRWQPAAGAPVATERLTWHSGGRSLAEWAAAPETELRSLLAQACTALAGQSLETGQGLWVRH